MSGLLDRRLLLVTGKGGVGKSTVAASLALRLASAGLRTLLCEVNADQRLGRMLGHPEVGHDVTRVEANLSMVDLEPDAAMREYVLSKIRLERVYRAVFENRMVRYFLRFVPALAETVMLGKVLWHLRQWPDAPGGFDRIVLDLPATGHALTLLGVPQSLVSTAPLGTDGLRGRVDAGAPDRSGHHLRGAGEPPRGAAGQRDARAGPGTPRRPADQGRRRGAQPGGASALRDGRRRRPGRPTRAERAGADLRGGRAADGGAQWSGCECSTRRWCSCHGW